MTEWLLTDYHSDSQVDQGVVPPRLAVDLHNGDTYFFYPGEEVWLSEWVEV